MVTWTPRIELGAALLLLVSGLFLGLCGWFCLFWDYCGKLRILRTKFIPAALRGVEASLLSLVGQEPAPTKCIPMSSSAAVRGYERLVDL